GQNPIIAVAARQTSRRDWTVRGALAARYPASMSTEQAAARERLVVGSPRARPIESAEMLSVGTELTVGDTRDTNAGDLAKDLVRRGVLIGRITAVPDRLEVVRDAFRQGLERSDLVVATGGLGPTPDDLTREAIAT